MKQKLSPNQINFILSQVLEKERLLPNTLTDYNYDKQYRQVYEMLSSIEIYEEMIPALIQKMQKMYQKPVEPGLAVGIITAQSIGEQQTQATLNAFHKSGLSESTVITGVPRFSELVDCTQSQQQHGQISKIYFKDDVKTIEGLRSMIGSDIKYLTLENVMHSVTVHPKGKDREEWYGPWEEVYQRPILSSLPCLSYSIDLEAMYTYKFTLEQVSEVIEKDEDLMCVFSPLHKSSD